MAHVYIGVFLVVLAVLFSKESFEQTIRLSGRLEQSGMNPEKSPKLLIIELLLPNGIDGPQVERNDQISDGADTRQGNSDNLLRTIVDGKALERVGTMTRGEPCNGHLHNRDGSSDRTSNFDVSRCPKPENATSVVFPPQCCSFPFTWNKTLYYGCFQEASGLYRCLIPNSKTLVYCDEPVDFVAHNRTVTMTMPFVYRFTAVTVNNWIVFQQRVNMHTNFPQSTWETSKVGFGRPDGLFWLGLEKVHKMTNSAPYKLRIEFMMMNGSWYSAEYDTFRVESESQYYRIHVGGYSGDLCDVMNIPNTGVTNGMKFSTYDRDNDLNSGKCAQDSTWGYGGWWHNSCGYFHLNGDYYGNLGFAVCCNSWYYFSASRMMLKKK